MRGYVNCKYCRGTGRKFLGLIPCPYCNGMGSVWKEKLEELNKNKKS